MRQCDEGQRCSYVVMIREAIAPGELRVLADYLTTLRGAGCDAVVLDATAGETFENHRRVLRWVARHLRIGAQPALGAENDAIRAAAAGSRFEKVIVADVDVRYSQESIARINELLDRHEVIEPQEYLDPLPWWSGIEAGRILMQRAFDPQPDHGATFAFRRSIVNTLPALSLEAGSDAIRRLTAAGAEIYTPPAVFVKREPSTLREWAMARPESAAGDFDRPLRSAFFLSLLPLLAALVFFGDVWQAQAYAAAVASGSIALAVRGRFGAGRYFPLRTALFAPLWVLERSISVYWALFRHLLGAASVEPSPAADVSRPGERVASGE